MLVVLDVVRHLFHFIEQYERDQTLFRFVDTKWSILKRRLMTYIYENPDVERPLFWELSFHQFDWIMFEPRQFTVGSS